METAVLEKKLSYTQKHLLSEFKPEILKALSSLEKLAGKLGLPAPQYKFSEDYQHEFSAVVEVDMDIDGKPYEVYEEFIETCFDLEINLEQTLKIAGDWSLVAENNHAMNEVYQIDEKVEIPHRFKPNNSECEHCGVRMPRVKSYIVRSGEEYKQVGRTCLHQFLGVNPKSYISMFEAVSKFSITIQGFGDKIKFKGGGGSLLAYNVEDFYKLTDIVVQEEGKFVKNEWERVVVYTNYGERDKMVRSNMGKSTYDKVIEAISLIADVRLNPKRFDWAISTIDKYGIENINKMLEIAETDPIAAISMIDIENFGDGIELAMIVVKQFKNALYDYNQHLRYNKLIAPISGELKAKFEVVKEWAQNLEIDNESGSDFENYKAGIKNCFSLKRILQTKAKYIVSAHNLYEKSLIKQEKPNSEYVGAVGDKMCLNLKITGYKTGEGSFGWWELWSMEDDKGNMFTKFGKLNDKYVVGNLDAIINPSAHKEETEQPKIIATFEIKNHKEFRGIKTTELGRISKP
jgi:hypothetical protein